MATVVIAPTRPRGDRRIGGSRFSQELFAGAQSAQRAREAADYDAAGAPPRQAAEIVALAERFVEAITAIVEA